MRLDLPSAARNPISLIGTAIATAMAVLFLVLIALEFGGLPVPRREPQGHRCHDDRAGLPVVPCNALAKEERMTT